MFKKILKASSIALLCSTVQITNAQTHYSIARLGTGAQGNFTENDKFNFPNGVAVDSDGKIFIADTDNFRVHVWTQSGTNFGYFKTMGEFGNSDGGLNKPAGVAIYQDKIFVADKKNHRIEIFTQSGGNFGFYARIAGSPNIGGYKDQPGPLNTELDEPMAVAVSPNGTIYICDKNNSRIQVWTQSGTNFGYIATMGTTGTLSSDNDKFYFPSGIALDASGKIFVADLGNSRVQVWTQSGINFGYFKTINTISVAGTSTQMLGNPHGVTIGSDGKIYVADANNARIQVWTQSGSNFGYFATVGKNGNGPDDLFYPTGVAEDANGKLYVVENYGNRINIFEKCSKHGVSAGPIIATQPINQTLCPNGAGYFQVSATGVGTLTYLWSFGDITTEYLQTANPGNYTVTVSSGCGSVVSNTVALTPGGITTSWVTQPISSQQICSGTTGTISVSATGTNVKYRWSSSVTSTTSTIAVSSDATYYAYAKGDCGQEIQSNQSSLSVIASTFIYEAPRSQTILATASANLSVGGIGVDLTYKWSSGETTPVIRNKPVGEYTVSVIGFCGVKTATAILSINTFPSSKVVFPNNDVKTVAGTSATITWPKLIGAITYCMRFVKVLPFTPAIANICGLDREEYLFVLSASGLRTENTTETVYYEVLGVDANGNKSDWSDTQTMVLRTDATTNLNYELLVMNYEFLIVPNPSTTGEFKVSNGKSVTIYDMLGKVILKTNEKSFNISSKGIFIAQVETANGVKFVKLAVE
ncbi:MAG: T9SS C-terminal target domain-containing protein [Cytophagales bacterium]|nr:MAG: T9SS C-terminal target domain-containing protein [Cytophagales bacterium]